MKKTNPVTLSIVLALVLSFASDGALAAKQPKKTIGPPWAPFPGEYNHGPDPSTEMGRWLMNLQAELPEYFAVSEELMDRQKFRYVFGTMMARAFFEPNRTKILFVGQDATGIAEASKRPGVSGFGGQVQGVGGYFGVDQGVATTNAYLSTISGQYGAFGHIYVESDRAGKPTIRQSKYVDNELWAITHHPASEIRISREKYWEWMLVNNPESMDMMVFFGDAAKDSFAQFLMARGFDVPMKMNPDKLKTVQVPETILVNAGGNAEFPVPVNKYGQDIYEILLAEKHGRVPPYFKKDSRSGRMVVNYAPPMNPTKNTVDVQKAAVEALIESGQRGIDMMVFTGGGIHGSGITDLGQIAEYDFNNVTFKGKKVRSLKGMKLKYFDHVVDRDVAFIESPHPTVLAKMDSKKKSETLKRAFQPLEKLRDESGWRITPDVDENGKPYVNLWDEGKDYVHRKKEIGTAYLEQGAPANKRTSSADFIRDGKQKIIANTREKARFDRAREEAALKSRPASAKNPDDIFSARPRTGELRYVYDDGPGDDISRLIAENLDLEVLLAPKPGMQVLEKGRDRTFEKHGIDAYYVKSHPSAEYFGTHRGSFQRAKALVLADPHGVDDWNTARALTGARGQYVHGLMEDLGFGEEYLVIRTAPFSMDGADARDWEFVRKNTEKYREALIARALENKIEIIFVDGPIAKREMDRVLKKLKVDGISVVEIARSGLDDASEGIVDAGRTAAKILGKRAKITGRHADIPTAHLPWWSRLWEGTGGVDLTIDAVDRNRGLAYKVITPNWVAYQEVKLLESTRKSIERIRKFLSQMGIRIGKEKLADFLSTRSGSWKEIEASRRAFFGGESGNFRPFLTHEQCVDLLRKSATAWHRNATLRALVAKIHRTPDLALPPVN